MQEIKSHTLQSTNRSFIRRYAYIYIPQPPPCLLPSVPPLEDVDEIQVLKISEDAFLLPTERRPVFHTQMHVHVSDTWQVCPVSQLSPAVPKS